MNPQNLIEVENAGVRYRLFRSRRRTLREAIFRTIARDDERIELWALRDVSFEVGRGESLGVIGANGAGKTTLCLLLSKIMKPTTGRVEVAGRVSALLALGTGFQGDLSGRDNIFINGTYLGHTTEQVRELMPQIIEFSELGDFIDQPVRTYSSGMRARLAFSIAQAIKPEILILDELMGVGDIAFQKKSSARMKQLIEESAALVVVSHSMQTIRELCTRCIWLDKGRLMASGPTEDVVGEYEKFAAGK